MCLSVFFAREIRSRTATQIPTSNLANLPRFDPSALSAATQTGSPLDLSSDVATATPWPTEIGGVVNPLTIKLREGPGVEFPVIQELRQHRNLSALGKDVTGTWIYVQAGGGVRGWVSYFSLAYFNFDLYSLPVIGNPVLPSATLTPTEIHTVSASPTMSILPSNTPSPSNTALPSITPSKTGTSIPSLTPTHTIQPTTTNTPLPFPPLPTPPGDAWCEQNTVRRVCVNEIFYYVDEGNISTASDDKLFIAFDVYIKNLSTFEIFVDPARFYLKLSVGSFVYFYDLPRDIPGEMTKLEYVTLSRNEDVQGILFIGLSNYVDPESLLYRGYTFEPILSIDFIGDR